MHKKILIITIISLSIILSLLTIFILTRVNQQLDSDKNSDITLYDSEFIKAELVNPWSINELKNNEGMNPLLSTNSEYEGLTGFEILKDNKVILSFNGVDGVGGINVCSEVYTFSDTEQSFIDNYINFANEQSLLLPNIIDLSNEKYIELKIFNKNVRRIDQKLYFDSETSDTYFNPVCDENQIIAFEKLYFKIQNNQESEIHTYSISFNAINLTESDLHALDTILSNLEYKNILEDGETSYTNPHLPNFAIQVLPGWDLTVKEFEDANIQNFQSKYFPSCDTNCMGIRLSKNDVDLNIIFDLASDDFGRKCSNLVEYEEISNNWIRIKENSGYFYSRNYELNVKTKSNENFNLGQENDEWSLLNNTNYNICVNGTGYFRDENTIINNSQVIYGTLVENPTITGNPSLDMLEEIDEMIKSLY